MTDDRTSRKPLTEAEGDAPTPRPLALRRRGKLDLENDRAQHRRYQWLYEDLLS